MPDEVREIPLAWQPAELTVSRYATNMVCQFSGKEYILSFFEAKYPLITGTAEQMQEMNRQVQFIQAECVARVIVLPERLRTFTKMIEEMLEREDERNIEACP